MEKVISVEHLKKDFTYYKKEDGLKGSLKNMFRRKTLIKEAVNDISFSVEKGEILALLGPNGAGKTTTLKMLSGILCPTAGEVSVSGFSPWERKDEYKRRFAIVMGQKNQLWWDLPAIETFYLNKSIYGVPDDVYQKRVEELSELLDVKDKLHIQARRLSLGERMKMEILAALIHDPEILFLDEPTIGLDIISQQKIREFLKTINEQRKTTIILTSHYMGDVEALCKRAVIINHGHLVYDGNLADISRKLDNQKLLTVKTSESISGERLAAFGKLREWDGHQGILEVAKADIKQVTASILQTLPVEDFTVTEIPLEESIAAFYGKEVVS